VKREICPFRSFDFVKENLNQERGAIGKGPGQNEKDRGAASSPLLPPGESFFQFLDISAC